MQHLFKVNKSISHLMVLNEFKCDDMSMFTLHCHVIVY